MRMAEDVEIISSERNTNVDEGMEVMQQPSISDRNGVSSTESTSDCIIDVVSTGDVQPVNVVSSLSDLPLGLSPHGKASGGEGRASSSERVRCELGSPLGASSSRRSHRSSPCSSTTLATEANTDVTVSASCDIVVVDQVSPKCSSDGDDCDIIVDDGPAPDNSEKDRAGRKRSKSTTSTAQIVRPFTDTPSVVCMSQVRRLSRSATPSPSVSRFTPSSPGTPRQRSGSLNGTLTPSPRPSARNTPGERPRAGSVGEIDKKETNGFREEKHGVRIVDNLDILQLPRPRNPGGVLPQNGAGTDNMENEALDLIINARQTKPRNTSLAAISTSSYTSFLPSNNITTMAALPSSSTSSSYLISNIIQSTPRKLTKPFSFPPQGAIRGWASTINESVERPQPSSVVDSEGVAKKIARLDDQNMLPSPSVENLWTGRLNSQQGTNFRNVRALADRTPPERPKPPRRGLSPMITDSMDVSGDRFISPSRRRRVSPVVSHGTNSGRSTPQSFGKALKCTLCDYTTHEKVHYRRHRRLHHRNASSLFRCGKCSYSSSLSRKMKDHYQQMHPEEAAPNLVSEFNVSEFVPTQRYISAQRNFGTEPVGTFPGPYYDNNSLDPLMLGRNERLGYPFMNPNRQSSLNYTIDQYNAPFGDIRTRQDDQLASSYLRSIVTSIINSESNSRHPPSSTVTSSSFFLPSSGTSHHTIEPCHSHDTCRHPNCRATPTEVKVKVEPDTDAVSDISSTANSINTVTPDITRHDQSHMDTNGSLQNGNADSSFEIHRPNTNRHRSLDNSLLQPLNPTNDVPTDLTSPRQGMTRTVGRAMSELTPSVNVDSQTHITTPQTNNSAPSSTIVKSDTTTRGVQCVLPLIKSELNLDGDYFDYLGRQRFSFCGEDRAVQCNLSSPTTTTTTTTAARSQRLGKRTQSASESELSEHHSSIGGESRCEHCGIVFDDEVIFSIHIGCHSHTDPFKCNVCGKQCGNKYAFYSHIMRGHQF